MLTFKNKKCLLHAFAIHWYYYILTTGMNIHVKAVFFHLIDCFPKDVFQGMSNTTHSMERSKGQ